MQTRDRRCFLILCSIGLVAWSASIDAAPPPDGTIRAIRRSDVVFMYDDPNMYKTYGCTVLGWAGRADAERIKAAHAQGVRRFATSVGFRTEFRQVIDFRDNFLDAACRNFAGEPFIVPWLWDHKYQGQPAWWWCTNSPLYRQYLDHRLHQVMAAGPDGLHIDDYTGSAGTVTWLSGCFCRHCMAGFRQYLAKHVSRDQLSQLGIGDFASFNYRQYLIDRGVTPQTYGKRRAGLPLAREFWDFQVKAATDFVAQYRRRAEQLRGKPLTLCVNSSLSSPQNLVIAPHLSYLCCEVPHRANARSVATHPIYIYKLADGLDRPVASTASGQDWAYIMDQNLPGLVRTWIALSYCHGHTFMAPHRQWCYTKEKGTRWYTGPAREYAYLYRFVREHASLLDGYQALAPVAVVYDNAARRGGQGDIESVCTTLARRNIPFTVVVAGDDWLDYRLQLGQLDAYRAVIVRQPLGMDEGQRRVIQSLRDKDRLVMWPDIARLGQLAGEPATVEGAENVMVVPRIRHDDRSAPMVVHVLNLQYDKDHDAMVPRGNITVGLSANLLDGRTFTKATLHAPGRDARPLAVRSDGGQVSVTIPELNLWAIVQLDPADCRL